MIFDGGNVVGKISEVPSKNYIENVLQNLNNMP